MRVDPCAKLSNLLNNMFLNRFVQVFLDDKSSRWRSLYNGLPQGSVLAPLLFSLYLSDIPSTLSNQFQYADDIALTYKHESFSDCEANLEVDLERLNQYFHRWRLQPNPSKTESCVFHLSTHITQTELWTYNLLPRRFNTLSTLNILISPWIDR
jgi:hypothetical protein